MNAGAIIGIVDELARHSFANFDNTGEDIGIGIAFVQGSNGHNLRDGTESEDFPAMKLGQIREAIGHQLQRISHQLVQTA